MNKNPTQPLRGYQATVIKDGKPICLSVQAENRRRAVRKALNWFWYEYRGSLGPVHKVMTVTDPYHEVRYGPEFVCNDRINKLLPLDVCLRLFVESKGKLVIDRREGKRYHQPNSLRRVKRRRDFGRFIAPGIKRMKNGVLYYRITTVSQRSYGGRLYRKRKYRDIRLEATTFESALGEIQMKKLHFLHAKKSARQMVVRQFKVLAHVLGLIQLSEYYRRKFSKVLRRYEKPSVTISTPVT